MSSFDWIDPRMKRNTRTRFQMGNGSSTVSYYPPQDALNVGRNPSPPVNQSNLPAIRQSGALALRQPAAIPSILSDNVSSRNFSLGQERPVSGGYRYFGSGQQAASSSPQLQIGYDGPKERISLGQVRQNLNKGKFVGPPTPEGYSGVQTQTPLPNSDFVGPKNMGAFGAKTTFGGAQAVDPSGGLLGELYRYASKATNRYVPGLEQAWGGQPNANEWRQGVDDAYKQATSGFQSHTNKQTPTSIFGALPKPPQQLQLSKSSNGMDATPENGQRAVEFGLPGAVAASEAMAGPTYGETAGSGFIYGGKNFQTKGIGSATGGFSRPSTADADLQRREQWESDLASQRQAEQAAIKQRDMQNEIASYRTPSGRDAAALGEIAAYNAASKQQKKQFNMTSLKNSFTDAQGYQGRLDSALSRHGLTPEMQKSQELLSQNNMRDAQANNYNAEALTRKASLPYISKKFDADIAGANAQAGLYTAQGALAGVQADAGRQTMVLQDKALKGDQAALSMLGKGQDDKMYSALGPYLKDGTRTPEEIQNTIGSIMSSMQQAKQAAKGGQRWGIVRPEQEARNPWFGKKTPAIPAQYGWIQ